MIHINVVVKDAGNVLKNREETCSAGRSRCCKTDILFLVGILVMLIHRF
jgi:hypothetical protein